MIVSDSGPIIIFARIGRLSLLSRITGSLLIPEAVYDEIVIKKGGMPGAAEVAQAAWIQKTSLSERSVMDGLPNVLHDGEREAIVLAKQRGAQLLIDEIRARRAAIQLGIEVKCGVSSAVDFDGNKSPGHGAGDSGAGVSPVEDDGPTARPPMNAPQARTCETIALHPSGADRRNSLVGCACGAPVFHGRDARATMALLFEHKTHTTPTFMAG